MHIQERAFVKYVRGSKTAHIRKRHNSERRIVDMEKFAKYSKDDWGRMQEI